MQPPLLAGFELDLGLDQLTQCRCPPLTNREDSAPTFAIIVEFFPCKVKLGDGSIRDIERDKTVRLDVEFSDIDRQELQSLEEKAVKNLVETIGESVFWGPNQEVSLLRLDNWKGQYVRIEYGEQMIAELMNKKAGQANK
jgi:hypothetical protein